MLTREKIEADATHDGVSVTERTTSTYDSKIIATVTQDDKGIHLYVGVPKGCGIAHGASITLSPSQAQHLARLLIAKAV